MTQSALHELITFWHIMVKYDHISEYSLWEMIFDFPNIIAEGFWEILN